MGDVEMEWDEVIFEENGSNAGTCRARKMLRSLPNAGMKDQTLQWLEKAYEQRELPLIHLKVGWDWDDVRDHPRFQNSLRQMKLIQ